ncbi:MAG: prolipoprotein diacylglyceryl transferase, partial [Deltaproteobacteria bacterium]|nr:prolipoprotein diacylglyceryl transferase [Deltaproteobacteria bacterium]
GILDLIIVLLFAGLIGARALHVVADGYWDDYVNLCFDPSKVKGVELPSGRHCKDDEQCQKANAGDFCEKESGLCRQERDCLRAFKIWYGGLTYYGGLILAFFAGLWFVRRYKMPVWKIGDLAGFAIPLGLFFGRLGCFFGGCCFGRAAECALCHTFPKHSPAWDHHVELGMITKNAAASLPVYPAQLLESFASLLIGVFLYIFFQKRKKFDGQVFWLMVILYSVMRFLVEFLRDDSRGEFLSLSTSQLLGIPMVAVALLMLKKLAIRSKGL